jgi:purine-binding chemotaxis protein CheW
MRAPLEGSSKVVALRQTFDESFATPPARSSEDVENILLVRIAGDPYAIRLRDIAAVVAKRRVVPVPASSSHLIGLAGIRGDIVPVFDLAPLLGYAHGPDTSRWMLVCALEETIALAFSELEGYHRLPRSAFYVEGIPRLAHEHAPEFVRTSAGARPVINMLRIVATIRNRKSHDALPNGKDQ